MKITLPIMPDFENDSELTEQDFHNYFSNMRKYNSEILKIGKSLMKRDCLSIKTKDGRYKLLSRDCISKDWRLTYYDEKGWPTGHDGYSELSEVLVEIMRGADETCSIPAPPATMDPLERILDRIKSGKMFPDDMIEVRTFHKNKISDMELLSL